MTLCAILVSCGFWWVLGVSGGFLRFLMDPCGGDENLQSTCACRCHRNTSVFLRLVEIAGVDYDLELGASIDLELG